MAARALRRSVPSLDRDPLVLRGQSSAASSLTADPAPGPGDMAWHSEALHQDRPQPPLTVPCCHAPVDMTLSIGHVVLLVLGRVSIVTVVI